MQFGQNLSRCLAALLSLVCLAGGAATAATVRGGVGVGFLYPRDAAVADLYGGGPTGLGLLELESSRPRLSLGIQASYFRATGNPGGLPFVRDGKAILTWIPLEVSARLPLSEALLAPFVGVGAQMLWTRERFDYELDGVPHEAEPATLFDLGWILLAGVDRTRPPRLRLEGFLGFVQVDRQIDRAGEAVRSHDQADAGTVGARVAWRFP